MNILLENTYYGLLLYLLIKKEWKNDLFVLYGLKINKIKNTYYYKNVSIRKNFLIYYIEIIKFFIWFSVKKLKIKKIKLYGNDNLKYFYNLEFYIIEDGTINYINTNLKLN